MAMIDEINQIMLEEMEKNRIEDTLENRYVFLLGIRSAWREDTSFEKTLQTTSLEVELMRLAAQIYA